MADLHPHPFGVAEIRRALAEGWQLANATRSASMGYAAIFTLIGALILGTLLAQGFTPFIVAAAGAFMLVGPVILAGFFGIATAHEQREKTGGPKVGLGATVAGFAAADRSVWALALVCALLFMIFATDAAILYSYMVGGTPVWLSGLIPTAPGVLGFLFWGGVSGAVIALLLFCISAFSVPLLCECRAGLVNAVVASVRAVFGNFLAAIGWAILLSALIIASILLLPLFPITLPWLAYASRALYRHVLP